MFRMTSPDDRPAAVAASPEEQANTVPPAFDAIGIQEIVRLLEEDDSFEFYVMDSAHRLRPIPIAQNGRENNDAGEHNGASGREGDGGGDLLEDLVAYMNSGMGTLFPLGRTLPGVMPHLPRLPVPGDPMWDEIPEVVKTWMLSHQELAEYWRSEGHPTHSRFKDPILAELRGIASVDDGAQGAIAWKRSATTVAIERIESPGYQTLVEFFDPPSPPSPSSAEASPELFTDEQATLLPGELRGQWPDILKLNVDQVQRLRQAIVKSESSTWRSRVS
jgi:hypothetical protein